jgi:hypothetical protein
VTEVNKYFAGGEIVREEKVCAGDLYQRKRKTIGNSRTSGKNHTTGYSQVCWKMIWRFALCVVPTSVLLQGDCMIFIFVFLITDYIHLD